MKELLEYVVESTSSSRVLVFDDDVMVHTRFLEQLDIVQSSKCAEHVFRHGRGVALLGASEWGKWEQIEGEMNQMRGLEKKPISCYSIRSKTFGSFAVLYTRNAALKLLEWLEMNESSKQAMPFDHAFVALQEHGSMVRVMHPNIAIMDVRHESDVGANRTKQENFKYRAKKHRWNLDDFPRALEEPDFL
mmetsp:Transcript_12504/g.45591  ORF Transcript_12504/g.45591 Transcript_12504/m.45591 type:complete len:190 (+) Transcript_12504:1182-1751(+)